MTATPRKPRITFPENPHDGQQITEIIDDSSCVIWTYEAETNSWKYQIYGLPQTVIYTDQVRVRGTDVAPMKAEDGEVFLQTQKDINHYLNDKAPDLEDVATEGWVENQGFATEEWVNEKGFATQSWTRQEIDKIPATDLSGHVTKEEFTQGQAEQDLEIQRLDSLVGQIEGKVGTAPYRYSMVNANPRQGDFVFKTGMYEVTTRWDNAAVLTFSDKDRTGNEYDFSRAVDGDVLRITSVGSPETSFAEYKVTGGDQGVFGVDQLLKSAGSIIDGTDYVISHLSSFDPAGLATTLYVDEGDQGVKDYVDERIAAIPEADPVPLDDYLPKSGGTMSGNLACEGYLTVKGPVARLYLKEEDGANKMTIYPSGLIETSGEIRVDKISGQLFTGKQNGTSTFRVYADGAVETEKATPPNDKALTTKGWVDGQIKKVQVPGYVWKYASHTTAQNLNDGEFFVADNGNVYLHFKTDCGRDLGVSNSATYEDMNFMVGVFAEQGNSFLCMTANQISFNNGSNKYIRLQKRHTHYQSSFTAGNRYHLSIPGFSS